MNLKLSLVEAVDGKIDLLHKIRVEQSQQRGAYAPGIVADEIDVAQNAPIYCWDMDIVGAILTSTASLPVDANLTPNLTPSPSGWWWFGKENTQFKGQFSMLSMKTKPVQHICAIGYKWHAQNDPDQIPVLTISAYSYDHNEPTYGPVPINIGVWKSDWTIAEYVSDAMNLRNEVRQKTSPRDFTTEEQPIVGHILDVLDDRWQNTTALIARFFIAANLWMKQTILEDPAIDPPRPAKKRAARAGVSHSLRYVRLRKTVRTKQADPEETKKVAWKCQWVVEGFWRNQYYPTKKGTPEEHRLIWINDFVKGPEGLPLKNPGGKLFVVDR